MKSFVKYKAIITLECEAVLESKYNWNEVEDYFKNNFDELVDFDNIKIETEAVDDWNEIEEGDILEPDYYDMYRDWELEER